MEQDDVKLVRLSNEYDDDLANFNCVNDKEEFKGCIFKAKQIRKFIEYSKNINEFLKKEALNEQEQGLNTTHLFYINNQLAGFISLCSDSIRLSLDEKSEDGVPYANIPSLKIARLAIDINFQGRKLGEYLIKFAVASALNTRKIMGVKFITVDCYKHRVSYYEQFGFKENKIVNEGRQPDNPKSFRLNIDTYLDSLNH